MTYITDYGEKKDIPALCSQNEMINSIEAFYYQNKRFVAHRQAVTMLWILTLTA